MTTIKTLVSAIVFVAIAMTASGQTSDFKSYSNFDFVAGNKVLVFDDFSSGNIGDFPVQWNTNGSGEIVTTEMYPGKWFLISPSSMTYLNAGLKPVDNFTVEFDIILNKGIDEISGEERDFQISFFSTDKGLDGIFPTSLYPGIAGIVLNFVSVWNNDAQETPSVHSFKAYNNETEQDISGKNTRKTNLLELGKQYRFSFWVQKTRLRLYINEEKVYDIQRAFPDKAKIDQIRFWTPEYEETSIFISNFRYADATEDSRSVFLTDGKLISYGIYFDSGKDILKPQSNGAIKEIATILNENPTVKVLITGHTDSDGDDKINLDLSKRRAENVKKVLVSEFKVNADRITTDGKGESEPIADNVTAENKAKNRRVEFIKQ